LAKSKKKSRQSGPMTAAGLISFYDEYEGKIKISPTTLIALSAIYAIAVVLAHIFG